MKYLRREYDYPWLCAGDFNEVLDAHEQFGGHGPEEWQMDGFRDAVEECWFDDLGYIGLPYTWDNRQQGSDNIKVRLDRGLGDDKFQEAFDNTSITHIQTTESDHCALLISVQNSNWYMDNKTARPFRFENAWTRHTGYDGVVANAWVPRTGGLTEVHKALADVRGKLQQWSRTEFGSVSK